MTADTSTPGVSDEEVTQLYKNSVELEKSEDAPPSPLTAPIALSADVPGANLLNGLVNAAPFSEFLHYKARANFTHKTDQGRIRKYSEEHPRLSQFCTVADLIFRIIVVGAILTIVGAVITGIILKTVYM